MISGPFCSISGQWSGVGGRWWVIGGQWLVVNGRQSSQCSGSGRSSVVGSKVAGGRCSVFGGVSNQWSAVGISGWWLGMSLTASDWWSVVEVQKKTRKAATGLRPAPRGIWWTLHRAGSASFKHRTNPES